MVKIIFLVGFMGSGKSTVATYLSKELGWHMIDLDSVIENAAGMPITEIFSKFGEQGFRERERTALTFLKDKEKIIVATGGGTPCFFDNMRWMNENGLTVYLNCSVDTLYERLYTAQDTRPLIKSFSAEELYAFISKKCAERNSYYLQSELQIIDIKNISKTVSYIKNVVFSM